MTGQEGDFLLHNARSAPSPAPPTCPPSLWISYRPLASQHSLAGHFHLGMVLKFQIMLMNDNFSIQILSEPGSVFSHCNISNVSPQQASVQSLGTSAFICIVSIPWIGRYQVSCDTQLKLKCLGRTRQTYCKVILMSSSLTFWKYCG